MTPPIIRAATGDDVATVVELWREFKAQEHEPAWRDEAGEADLRELELAIVTDIVLLAEHEDQAIGIALADTKGKQVGYLHILYVRACARRSGVAAALVRETAKRLRADGRSVLELGVLASNKRARSVYQRWGFAPAELRLAAPLDELVERLSSPPRHRSERRRRCDVDAAGPGSVTDHRVPARARRRP
jgi:ribosomal protein S18 acetylase RimI-like enzyme